MYAILLDLDLILIEKRPIKTHETKPDKILITTKTIKLSKGSNFESGSHKKYPKIFTPGNNNSGKVSKDLSLLVRKKIIIIEKIIAKITRHSIIIITPSQIYFKCSLKIDSALSLLSEITKRI